MKRLYMLVGVTFTFALVLLIWYPLRTSYCEQIKPRVEIPLTSEHVVEAKPLNHLPSYCGWATSGWRGLGIDCRSVMVNRSLTHLGGCTTVECADLAACQAKCNACVTCQAVTFAISGVGGIRCHMMGNVEASSVAITNPNPGGWAHVVNTRSTACQAAPGSLHDVSESQHIDRVTDASNVTAWMFCTKPWESTSTSDSIACPRCTSQSAKSTWGSYSVANVLDKIQIHLRPARKVTVACAVYTYHGNRQRLVDSYYAWGKYFDVFLAYSDETWTEPWGAFSTIPLREGLAKPDDLWFTVQKMWLDIADRLDSNSLDFDFLAICGEDAFWIVENLRFYLAGLSRDDYLHIGGIPEKNRGGNFSMQTYFKTGPWVYGSGYLVSKRVVAERKLSQCPQEHKNGKTKAEDIKTSFCLQYNGIFPIDTRDNGTFRFCNGPPNLPCENTAKPMSVSDFAKMPATVSKSAVLFHYVSGVRLYSIYNRLYGCRDINGQFKALDEAKLM